MPNYIALAVPFFFLFIGLEVFVAARRKRAVYRFHDAVSNVSAGVFQQVSLIFGKAALIAAYVLVWQRFRLFDLPAKSAWTWALGIVLVDLSYYWWHRLSHEVNFLWAAHVVHHSSEEYNLAVALRQGFLTPWTVVPFHAPLALLGIPPVVMIAVDAFNTLYQFWIHTQLIGKLGRLEGTLNTPSAHRVHHAVNPRYLDKNYGGTSVVWDRLFGTYEPETEPCVYGVVKPLESFNPIWTQVHYFADLWKRSAAAPRLGDKLLVWLHGPPWTPPGVAPFPPPPEVSPATFRKYDPSVSQKLQAYVLVQAAVVISFATALMFLESSLPLPQLVAGALLVYLALVCWGGLFEARRWAVPLEVTRLLVTCGAAVLLAAHGPHAAAVTAGAVGSAAFCAAWLLRVRPVTVVGGALAT